MTNYSLLFVDDNDNIGGSRQVACPSDEHALAAAIREAKHHRAVEVWAGDQSIGLVLAKHREVLDPRGLRSQDFAGAVNWER
jgi:hypothetical protein